MLSKIDFVIPLLNLCLKNRLHSINFVLLLANILDRFIRVARKVFPRFGFGFFFLLRTGILEVA